MRMILTYMWIEEKKIISQGKHLKSHGKSNKGRSASLNNRIELGHTQKACSLVLVDLALISSHSSISSRIDEKCAINLRGASRAAA